MILDSNVRFWRSIGTASKVVRHFKCRILSLSLCAKRIVKAKFHYAIQLANQLASLFASWSATR